MPTIAAATLPSAGHPGVALSLPRLPLPVPAPELLVVVAPLLLVPTAGTPGDWLRLAVLLGLLVGADALTGTARPAARTDRRTALAAALAAGLWLAAAALLGPAPMILLALYLAIRCLRRLAGPTGWPMDVAAAALGTAVALDLSLVTLGLERDSVWLGLGAAVGTACAAARLLAESREGGAATAGPEGAEQRGSEAALEVVLVTATVLVLGLYGTLLAHEPVLRVPAVTGGHLGIPLLALALLRLALRALADRPPRGVDRPGLLLLGAWALVTATLMHP
jgi:hypothetical protein